MKKIFALISTIILTLFFTLSFFPTIAFAADTTISSGGTYDLASYGNGSTITISTTDAVTLTQSSSGTALTNFRIRCNTDGANLTISGINIDNNANDNRCALSFTGAVNSLTLVGSSMIKSGNDEPGVRVEGSTELTISGEGSVSVTGGNSAAGIGGGYDNNGGTITISGGTVIATGGTSSAGIGGGAYGNGGTITISGGTVTATGEKGSAGIGGGFYGNGGTITISGGIVTANGGPTDDAYGGAGIGGGYQGDSGIIIISGGIVTANGGPTNYAYGGAGIGSGGSKNAGIFGNVGTITISGGTVTANGSGRSAGIGNSYSELCYGDSGTITISGGTVIANGGVSSDGGPGIGGRYGYDDSIINISGGIVTATGGGICAGIGSGNPVRESNGTIGISNHAQVTATGGADGGAGIGGCKSKSGATISISGDAQVHATGGGGGAGVGGGMGGDGGSITISGGTVTANGSGGGSGIGYGEGASGGDITIFDVIINATGGVTGTSIGGDTISTQSSGYVSSISLNKSTLSITQNETVQLMADITPADSDSTIFWTNSNPAVATVDQSGNVTGAGVGTCMIIAAAGGVSDTCTVSVSAREVETVSLSYGKKTMYVGDVFALSAIVLPDDATNKSIEWTTSDSSVAKVTSAGLVSAIGKGTCTITATADGKSDSCSVSVNIAPTPTPSPTATPQPYVGVESVRLMLETNFTAVLYVGNTLNLSAAVIPSNADNQSLVWKSSDESVLTVSSYGLVKAVSAGEATVTVTAGRVSDSYAITVKAAGDIPSPSASPTSADATPSPLPSVGDVMLNFAINTESLPYGAEYILLPDGEVMPLSDESTMTVCVNQCHLNDGVLQITALDAAQNPLGAVEVSADKRGMNVVLLVLIALGTLLAGIGGTLAVLKIAINRK